MKKNHVVYTAIFGDYDILNEPKLRNSKFDFVCFTDNPNLTSSAWEIRLVSIGVNSAASLNRKIKMLPHKYFPEYSFSLYIDGNIQLVADPTKDLLSQYENVKLAIPPHPECNCSYDEVVRCKNAGLIGDTELKNWHQLYQGKQFPRGAGLFENNVIFRQHHDASVIELMEDWWKEYCLSGGRDQFTLVFLAWEKEIPIHPIKYGPRISKEYFRIKLHCPGLNRGPLIRMIRLIELNKFQNRFYWFMNEVIRAAFRYKRLFKVKLKQRY